MVLHYCLHAFADSDAKSVPDALPTFQRIWLHVSAWFCIIACMPSQIPMPSRCQMLCQLFSAYGYTCLHGSALLPACLRRFRCQVGARCFANFSAHMVTRVCMVLHYCLHAFADSDAKSVPDALPTFQRIWLHVSAWFCIIACMPLQTPMPSRCQMLCRLFSAYGYTCLHGSALLPACLCRLRCQVGAKCFADFSAHTVTRVCMVLHY